MEWYEICAIFFFLVSFGAGWILLVFHDIKRIREAILCLKKEQQFYDIAGEWFNNQLNK